MGIGLSFTDVSLKKLFASIISSINKKQDRLTGTPGSIICFDESGKPHSLSPDVLKGADGISVSSVEQISSSTADDGTNTFRITLSNGKTTDFSVKNGSKGDKGDTGATGPQGPKGATGPAGTNATTTSVATTAANGLMSPTMVTKLNGVEAGANKCTEMSDASIENIFNSIFK